MYIANERHVSSQDVDRYFGNCFVRDPRTKKPGVISEITLDYVRIATLGDERTYEGEERQQFYSLDTYVYPKLGFRQVSVGVPVYLERKACGVHGRRGLHSGTLSVKRSRDFSCGNFADRLLLEALPIPSMCAEELSNLVFTPTSRPWREVVPTLDPSHGVVLSSSVCLWPCSVPQRRHAILFHKTVVGYVQAGKIHLASPSILKSLGDTNGIDVVFT